MKPVSLCLAPQWLRMSLRENLRVGLARRSGAYERPQSIRQQVIVGLQAQSLRELEFCHHSKSEEIEHASGGFFLSSSTVLPSNIVERIV